MPSAGEHDLVDLIYQAGAEPERFPGLLSQLAGAFSADAANCNILDAHLEHANLCATHGIPADAVDTYAEYYGERDQWRLGAYPGRMILGRVYRGAELVSDRDLERSEFHADHLSRLDLFHWCGARIARWNGGQAVISLQRARRRQPFSDRDAARFEALVPHIRRAVLMFRQIAAARRRGQVLAHLSDVQCTGIVVVDGAGRLAFANAAGERLLEQGTVLTVRDGRVAAARKGDDDRLVRLVDAVARRGEDYGTVAGRCLAIPGPEQMRPLLVRVLRAPLPGSPLEPDAGFRLVALQVVDPDAGRAPPERELQEWFSLTPSEAHLARLLGEGMPLRSSAEIMGITRESARQYLKRVFRKTGCHRQAELVRVIQSARQRDDAR